MRVLLFGGNQLVTGEAIADAIVDYSIALGRLRRSDDLEIPVYLEGTIVRARVHLSPAIPFAWVEHGPPMGVLDRNDHEVAMQIRARTIDAESIWFPQEAP
ncbi:hypothetical protein [Agromyces laixinhei]|uniref:hypothetical protein n=1 Tax=Agromyces laixinhei TaxID=2585717 RepID=UPI0012EE7B1B|nr:hypothetical protein [Agromyces laixinhei]